MSDEIKDLGIKIISKEQDFWEKMKLSAESEIRTCEHTIEINRNCLIPFFEKQIEKAKSDIQ